MRTIENQLRENYENNEVTSDITFKEYVEREAENDPNFFRCFFNEEFDNDFDNDLSDEQKEEFENYLNSL